MASLEDLLNAPDNSSQYYVKLDQYVTSINGVISDPASASCTRKSFLALKRKIFQTLEGKTPALEHFVIMIKALQCFTPPEVTEFVKFFRFGLTKMMSDVFNLLVKMPTDTLHWNKSVEEFVCVIEDIAHYPQPGSNNHMCTLIPAFIESLQIITTPLAAIIKTKLEITRVLNELLTRCPVSKRAVLMTNQSIYTNIVKIGEKLHEAGDFEYQQTLLETFFRLTDNDYRLRLASQWFGQFNLTTQCMSIRQIEFETDSRYFLNNLNNACGSNRSIYTFSCNEVTAGSTKLPLPVEVKEFWIDCNVKSQCISFCIEALDSTQDETGSIVWEYIYIYSHQVKQWKSTGNLINIILSAPLSVLPEATSLQFQLTPNSVDSCIEEGLIRTLGHNKRHTTTATNGEVSFTNNKVKQSIVTNPIRISSIVHEQDVSVYSEEDGEGVSPIFPDKETPNVNPQVSSQDTPPNQSIRPLTPHTSTPKPLPPLVSTSTSIPCHLPSKVTLRTTPKTTPTNCRNASPLEVSRSAKPRPSSHTPNKLTSKLALSANRSSPMNTPKLVRTELQFVHGTPPIVSTTTACSDTRKDDSSFSPSPPPLLPPLTERKLNRQLSYREERVENKLEKGKENLLKGRQEKEQFQKENVDKGKLQKEKKKREKERFDKEKKEKEKLEKEKREKEKREKERIEKERLQKEKERIEREKKEAEKKEKERLEKEEQERFEKERKEKERKEAERLQKEKERLEKEKEMAKLEKEKKEKERKEAERLEKKRIEEEKKERLEREKLQKAKIEKERKEREKLQKELEEKRLKEEAFSALKNKRIQGLKSVYDFPNSPLTSNNKDKLKGTKRNKTLSTSLTFSNNNIKKRELSSNGDVKKRRCLSTGRLYSFEKKKVYNKTKRDDSRSSQSLSISLIEESQPLIEDWENKEREEEKEERDEVTLGILTNDKFEKRKEEKKGEKEEEEEIEQEEERVMKESVILKVLEDDYDSQSEEERREEEEMQVSCTNNIDNNNEDIIQSPVSTSTESDLSWKPRPIQSQLVKKSLPRKLSPRKPLPRKLSPKKLSPRKLSPRKPSLKKSLGKQVSKSFEKKTSVHFALTKETSSDTARYNPLEDSPSCSIVSSSVHSSMIEPDISVLSAFKETCSALFDTVGTSTPAVGDKRKATTTCKHKESPPLKKTKLLQSISKKDKVNKNTNEQEEDKVDSEVFESFGDQFESYYEEMASKSIARTRKIKECMDCLIEERKDQEKIYHNIQRITNEFKATMNSKVSAQAKKHKLTQKAILLEGKKLRDKMMEELHARDNEETKKRLSSLLMWHQMITV